MTEHTEATTGRRPSRRAILIAGVVLLAAITVIIIAVRRQRATTAKSGELMAGMAGMSGMSSDGTVKLTTLQIRQFGVTFDVAAVRTLSDETRASGSVGMDETRMAQVAPRFGGFVERLHANFTGQSVRRGAPLLDVYSPEIVAAEEELLLARRLDRASSAAGPIPGAPSGTTDLVRAARHRLQLLGVTDSQIDQVLRDNAAQRSVTLYAPAGGVIVEKNVVQGQSFQPGDKLYTITDLSEVWIDVQLRETDMAAVRAGSSADVEVAGLPGRTFKGRVGYVYPTVDSVARSLRARVVAANSDLALKPGMYATVRLSTPSRSALSVPNSAVIRTGERNVVFVDMGGGELMPHEVTLGRSAGDYTEVLAGLEAGQRVVTSAQFLLESESNLADVMRSMLGQTGTAGMGEAGDKGADMRGMKGMSMPPERR